MAKYLVEVNKRYVIDVPACVDEGTLNDIVYDWEDEAGEGDWSIVPLDDETILADGEIWIHTLRYDREGHLGIREAFNL